MKRYNLILLLLNTAGIVALALLQLCSKRDVETRIEHTETRIVYDSTQRTPKPVTPPVIVSTNTMAIPPSVDTAAILRAYFATNSYTQAFGDSAISAIISTTVGFNRLLDQAFTYRWLRPTSVETVHSTTITLPCVAEGGRGLYVGGFIDKLSNPSNIGAGPMVSWQTKRGMVISYGFDATSSAHRVGIQQRIRW